MGGYVFRTIRIASLSLLILGAVAFTAPVLAHAQDAVQTEPTGGDGFRGYRNRHCRNNPASPECKKLAEHRQAAHEACQNSPGDPQCLKAQQRQENRALCQASPDDPRCAAIKEKRKQKTEEFRQEC